MAAGLGLWLLIGCLSALAYPPAPYHLIYGQVRDQYGTPIQNSDVQVVLFTPSGKMHSTTIVPGLAVGVNYLLRVPMDSLTTPGLYRSNALATASLFNMFVVVGKTTNAPIQLVGANLQLGEPAQMTRIDLTLGVDSNGDGIPDAWEQAFLGAIGSSLSLSNLNGGLILTSSGRTLLQEYLLGTTLFDPDNPFAARIVSSMNGVTVLEFPTMTGRAYSVLASPDLQQWQPQSFQLVAEGTNGLFRSNYIAPDIQIIQVLVKPQLSTPPKQFYKVQLQ